jgi:metallothionein
MAEAKKCEHASCTCTVSGKDKYCSARCEAAGDKVEVACECGHPGCRGEILKA